MQRKAGSLPNLDERLAAMRSPPNDPTCAFHAITLTADAQGRVSFGMFTEWVGYADEARRVELRQSSPVTASYARVWEMSDVPYMFVYRSEDLLPFLVAGGHALVEQSIAEQAFPEKLKPRPCFPNGHAGFIGAGLVEPGAHRRAPTPKLRMAVLKRDGFRCRICGRKPDDNVDLVLHVHHIRPWEIGGMTRQANLITLCHTCHGGLDPHFERSLLGYVEQDDAPSQWVKFHADVANYRRVGFFGDI